MRPAAESLYSGVALKNSRFEKAALIPYAEITIDIYSSGGLQIIHYHLSFNPVVTINGYSETLEEQICLGDTTRSVESRYIQNLMEKFKTRIWSTLTVSADRSKNIPTERPIILVRMIVLVQR